MTDVADLAASPDGGQIEALDRLMQRLEVEDADGGGAEAFAITQA